MDLGVLGEVDGVELLDVGLGFIKEGDGRGNDSGEKGWYCWG